MRGYRWTLTYGWSTIVTGLWVFLESRIAAVEDYSIMVHEWVWGYQPLQRMAHKLVCNATRWGVKNMIGSVTLVLVASSRSLRARLIRKT